ncbi:hypothetical protein VTN77DRAFT_3721 [Rasamsonia byssochlamydoides]|uniref:uncharacterized protein n=1 Tax=Rasamsonia byssochlamydoides TaxID=89139 RepID=UPI0037420B0C
MPQIVRVQQHPANPVQAEGGIEQGHNVPVRQRSQPVRRVPVNQRGGYGQAQQTRYHQIQRSQRQNERVVVPGTVYRDENGNVQLLRQPNPVFLQQYPHGAATGTATGAATMPNYVHEPHRLLRLPHPQQYYRVAMRGRGQPGPLPQPQRRAGRGPLFPRDTFEAQPMNMDIDPRVGMAGSEFNRAPQTDDSLSSLYVEAPDSPTAQNRDISTVSVSDENEEHPIQTNIEARHETREVHLEQEQETAREYGLDLSNNQDRAWWFLVLAADQAYQQLKKEETAQRTSEVRNQSAQPHPGPNDPTDLASSPAQAQSWTESVITEMPTDITRPDSSVSASN